MLFSKFQIFMCFLFYCLDFLWLLLKKCKITNTQYQKVAYNNAYIMDTSNNQERDLGVAIGVSLKDYASLGSLVQCLTTFQVKKFFIGLL